jgi:hypothetical protein
LNQLASEFNRRQIAKMSLTIKDFYNGYLKTGQLINNLDFLETQLDQDFEIKMRAELKHLVDELEILTALKIENEIGGDEYQTEFAKTLQGLEKFFSELL